ncbi:hypothetical protein [Massilia psychrophila]|jgi:hypothetical protein|uniref:Uncharacterized protein n=1 Tax=Massilia psychrophila TaxID=1603353 RepID=A0A2G8SWY6_9BURK|nr:hypothetical protein [Massilia psychrophila]PIL38213.1 hypothetical protein CR103_19165 [Massilia psychrophila]
MQTPVDTMVRQALDCYILNGANAAHFAGDFSAFSAFAFFISWEGVAFLSETIFPVFAFT